MHHFIAGPTALIDRDFPAHLAVLVDGIDVAPAIPILLLRQPTAELASRPDRMDLSPLGQVIDARLKSVSHRLPGTLAPA